MIERNAVVLELVEGEDGSGQVGGVAGLVLKQSIFIAILKLL